MDCYCRDDCCHANCGCRAHADSLSELARFEAAWSCVCSGCGGGD